MVLSGEVVVNVTRTRSPCCTVSSGPGTVPRTSWSTPPLETFRASRVKLFATGWPATVATRMSTDTDGWAGDGAAHVTMPGASPPIAVTP